MYALVNCSINLNILVCSSLHTFPYSSKASSTYQEITTRKDGIGYVRDHEHRYCSPIMDFRSEQKNRICYRSRKTVSETFSIEDLVFHRERSAMHDLLVARVCLRKFKERNFEDV